MIYLLDSNTCIHALRKKGNALVKQRIAACPVIDLALCSIVESELLTGAELSHNPTSSLAITSAFVQRLRVLPFDSGSARRYAGIRSDLSRRELLIGPYDTQIAAIALQHDLTVVTHNTAEFSRIPGLKLVDWELP
jgi:tRNA(fMet)-specific endonuclease VapC